MLLCAAVLAHQLYTPVQPVRVDVCGSGLLARQLKKVRERVIERGVGVDEHCATPTCPGPLGRLVGAVEPLHDLKVTRGTG